MKDDKSLKFTSEIRTKLESQHKESDLKGEYMHAHSLKKCKEQRKHSYWVSFRHYNGTYVFQVIQI